MIYSFTTTLLTSFDLCPYYCLSWSRLFIIPLKDFFQIVFFIVVATVGAFTYLSASETLFTPIRTEIFKLQVYEFEKILFFLKTRLLLIQL